MAYGKRWKLSLRLSPRMAPAFGLGHDAAQGAFKFVEEVVAQAGLLLFIPEGGCLQFLAGFRMADDAH